MTYLPPEPTHDLREDRSLGELFGEMTSELSTLVRKELELAKVEIRDDVKKSAKGGGMLAAGSGAAYFALLFFSFAVAWGLAAVMPDGLAFLIVAVIYGVAAFLLLKAGQERMKQVDPTPHQTIETLKEDVAWAKARTS